MSKEINIPEKLNDITLKQWQSLTAIDNEAEQALYIRRVLSIIYDINGREANKMKSKDISYLINAVDICLKEKPVFENRFMMEGVEYGIIPNFDDMTFGELVDVDKYSTTELYNKLMGVLYRPIARTQSGERYDIVTYENAKDMGSMPTGVALGCIAFFLTIARELTQDTLNSLTPMEQQAAVKFGLGKNGDGTPLSMPSVMEIFYN